MSVWLTRPLTTVDFWTHWLALVAWARTHTHIFPIPELSLCIVRSACVCMLRYTSTLTRCGSLWTRGRTVGWREPGWCTRSSPGFQQEHGSLTPPDRSWGKTSGCTHKWDGNELHSQYWCTDRCSVETHQCTLNTIRNGGICRNPVVGHSPF